MLDKIIINLLHHEFRLREHVEIIEQTTANLFMSSSNRDGHNQNTISFKHYVLLVLSAAYETDTKNRSIPFRRMHPKNGRVEISDSSFILVTCRIQQHSSLPVMIHTGVSVRFKKMKQIISIKFMIVFILLALVNTGGYQNLPQDKNMWEDICITERIICVVRVPSTDL